MAFLWLIVFCLLDNKIQGFDTGRKLWKDMMAKPETELTNLGADPEGRVLSLLSDELRNMDDENEAFLTDDSPDFADRGSPVLDDELHNRDNFNQDVWDPMERGWTLASDKQQDFEEPDTAMSDLAEDDPDIDKRNGLTIFDMFTDISDRLDAMQEQIDELKDGKKLDSCPDWWYSYQKSCYLFSRQKLSWYDAMSFCEEFDGYLAEINSNSENYFIWGKVKTRNAYFWVGGTDTIKENHWMWVHSKTPLTTKVFLDWGSGLPDNLRGNQHCMDLRPYIGGWNDYECDASQYFICERELK